MRKNKPNAMRVWLDTATTEQAQALAKAAGTSVPHLRHLGAGRRHAEAALAQRIAIASHTLKVRALVIDPRALCTTCAKCPIVDKRKAPVTG
jgi:hypothetical protein